MPTAKTSKSSATPGEQQLATLVAKLESDKQKLVLSLRKAVLKRLPTLNELVYDYPWALVLSYSPIDSGADAIVAISAEADGVRFVFGRGASLHDPQKILMGKAGQIRFIRPESAVDLQRTEVEALIVAAIKAAKIPVPKSGKGMMIIKSSNSKTKSKSANPKKAAVKAKSDKKKPMVKKKSAKSGKSKA